MSRSVHLLGRLTATFLCVAGVPLAVVTLVHWFFDVPISAFRPVINDEVTYWHQALTFSHVGFHGGYYTLSELTNASGFTPFGPHGPGFAVAYGIFGALLGWHRHSVVVLNLAAISAATAVWVTLSRATTMRVLLAALLLVTFWPLMYWTPTGMQEGLHCAGAIAMAGFFAHALRSSPRRSILVVGWLVLAALCFIRPSWLVLVPLWSIAAVRPRTTTMWLTTLIGALVVSLVILITYSRSVAPFPAGFFFLKAFDLSIGARALGDNVLFNLRRLVMFGEYESLEVLHRLQYWLWLLAAIVAAAIGLWRARSVRAFASSCPQLLVAVSSMAAALALMMLLYTLTNWAEHRVLSSFLLFGAMLAVTAPTRTPLVLASALVVSNLVTMPLFLDAFRAGRQDNFIWDRRGVYELTDALAGKVVYRSSVSRWCNTLLTSQYPPYLIAVPAGIGLSVVREADQLALPPRSQYLLLDPPSLAELKRPVRLEPLATLSYGTLYRNLEAGCPQ